MLNLNVLSVTALEIENTDYETTDYKMPVDVFNQAKPGN